ncbi:hypothetical protein YTPLAS73_14730 [Nitrosarchaeum sp.]|nr:hypothetical protein YTPLAS73_14730 [Nitrosarchaeum sp.]
MAKNERIIAQDLAEIKHAIQTQDITKISEWCEKLSREIKKYPVKPNVIDRLEHITNYPKSSLNITLDEKIKEISNLIDILIYS